MFSLLEGAVHGHVLSQPILDDARFVHALVEDAGTHRQPRSAARRRIERTQSARAVARAALTNQGRNRRVQNFAAFARMDQSSREDWMKIARATIAEQARTGEAVLTMLKSFESLHAGFGVSQLHHALQTATMASAPTPPTSSCSARCATTSAKTILDCQSCADRRGDAQALRVRGAYRIVATHQDFQGRHYYEHFGKSPTLREHHRHEPWFADAERFTDEWDQAAFDASYPVLPLEEFAPLVRQFFASYPMGY